MPITPQTLAREVFADKGRISVTLDENGLALALGEAVDRLKDAEGDLIPKELRLAAAALLIPPLPCSAEAWAMQCLEGCLIGPAGMTTGDINMGGSLIQRILNVREMLYDYAKALEAANIAALAAGESPGG